MAEIPEVRRSSGRARAALARANKVYGQLTEAVSFERVVETKALATEESKRAEFITAASAKAPHQHLSDGEIDVVLAELRVLALQAALPAQSLQGLFPPPASSSSGTGGAGGGRDRSSRTSSLSGYSGPTLPPPATPRSLLGFDIGRPAPAAPVRSAPAQAPESKSAAAEAGSSDLSDDGLDLYGALRGARASASSRSGTDSDQEVDSLSRGREPRTARAPRHLAIAGEADPLVGCGVNIPAKERWAPTTTRNVLERFASFTARAQAARLTSQRNEHERLEVSRAVDALVEGRPDVALELLIRRLVVVEDADRSGSWHLAPVLGFGGTHLGDDLLRRGAETEALRHKKLYGGVKRAPSARSSSLMATHGTSRRSRGGSKHQAKRKKKGGGASGAAADSA